jgi:hypothetical protein
MSIDELGSEEMKRWYDERVTHVRHVVSEALDALEEQRGLEDAEAVKAMVRGLYLPFELLLAALEHKYPNVYRDGETGEVIEYNINDDDEADKL